MKGFRHYMIRYNTIDDTELLKAIKSSLIRYGGHRKHRIYGTLACEYGKRINSKTVYLLKIEKTPLAMVTDLVEIV